MQADELEPAHELGARLAPCLLAERRRDWVAVENGKNDAAKGIELAMSFCSIGPQHALDQFRHHGQPQRIGSPTRLLDGRLEARFAKKDLGIMSGARAGVLVDAFL